MSDKYEGVKHVVHVSTWVSMACDECHASVGPRIATIAVLGK